MPVIDERGRLFGKANLIDVAVTTFILLLVPLGYASYRLFRVLPPRIDAVEPAQIVQGQTQRVRIRGEHLRFLQVYLNGIPAERFLIENPLSGEVMLPPGLKPGIYDLTLQDEAQEVARVPRALTVVGPSAPAGERKTGELAVRFLVYLEVVPLLRVGLEDQPTPPPPGGQPGAKLLSYRKIREISSDVGFNMGLDQAGNVAWVQVPQTVALIDARVQVPLDVGPDGWRYNSQPLKIGAPFTMQTSLFFLKGWIVSIDLNAHDRPAADARP